MFEFVFFVLVVDGMAMGSCNTIGTGDWSIFSSFSFCFLLYFLSFLPVGLVSAMAYLGWDGRVWYDMA